VIPFPNKKYNIIYADPPWNYETRGEGGSRNVTNKYNTMSKDEIWNLPIQNITDDNCVLFIWVTFPKIIEGIETIKKWGFDYSTCGFVWVKANKNYNNKQLTFVEEKFDTFMGLGYWTRANAELCLIAKKGSIERQSRGVHQIVYEPIQEHSRKPDCVKDKIIQLCGDLPRIELFARRETQGWDVWGNEVCMT